MSKRLKCLACSLRFYHNWRHSRLRVKTGIDMWINCGGLGLHVVHGKEVISPCAQIDTHCRLMSSVTIGVRGDYDDTGVIQM